MYERPNLQDEVDSKRTFEEEKEEPLEAAGESSAADADAASTGLLKRVSIRSPDVEIIRQVGEYELSLDPAAPRMKIVFDPCQITGVPSPH